MNLNNISNIDNVLSEKISDSLFNFDDNNFFVYLSKFNEDSFSIERLLENKIYFEIQNNKFDNNKFFIYQRLFDLSILNDKI